MQLLKEAIAVGATVESLESHAKEVRDWSQWRSGIEEFIFSQENPEQIVIHIEQGDVLDLVAHPNQEKYPGQQIIVVEINEYAYLVPFVESSEGKFLKTIIPSRKVTRDYLGGKNEQDKT